MATVEIQVEHRSRLAVLWARGACRLAWLIGPGRAYSLAMWGVRRFATWRIVGERKWRTWTEYQNTFAVAELARIRAEYAKGGAAESSP